MALTYIAKEKVALHLKLGRKLALFCKVDTCFDAITFDWIRIEAQGALYKTTLQRSVHQGDEVFNDVLSFDTLNQEQEEYDESTNAFFVGPLAECFTWIESKYGLKELSFVPLEQLKIIYTALLEKGAFD